MAIKTDMSKTYDRVEWAFIQALLKKLGFDTKWIKLMVECISSVQYKVLLNGHLRGLICHKEDYTRVTHFLLIYSSCVWKL